MIDDRVRAALKNDIAGRLLEGGRKRWKEIQSRYPQVSSATFFRLVEQVKTERKGKVGEPSVCPTKALGNIIAEIPGASDTRPVQGSRPEARLSAGGLILEIATLFDDADRLRRYALDSAGEIKNPAALVQSSTLRDRALRSAVGMLAEIYRTEAAADYFEALTEAVLAADPETGKRVMLAMYEIQTRNLEPPSKIRRGFSGGQPEPIA